MLDLADQARHIRAGGVGFVLVTECEPVIHSHGEARSLFLAAVSASDIRNI